LDFTHDGCVVLSKYTVSRTWWSAVMDADPRRRGTRAIRIVRDIQMQINACRSIQPKKTRILNGCGLSDYLAIFFALRIGAGERNRTLDLLITSELLYQLSYTGTACRGTRRVCIVMNIAGFVRSAAPRGETGLPTALIAESLAVGRDAATP
jgi:hypothetical protein